MARAKRTRKWRSPKTRTTSARRSAPARRKRAKTGKTRGAKGARAMWKGRITFGSIDVPVKLYSAVRDKSIHFRLLDPKRKEPVRQHMVDPESGDVVPHEEIHSAYQTKAGELVMLDESELEAAEPEPSRDIEVTTFVDPSEVGPEWYDRPYWLGPDEGSDKAYFALARALANQKREGIARWVMRKKDYVGAIRAEGDYLALITLRHAGEVVPASALPRPGGREPDKREVAMAKQLVDAMKGELEITAFKDEYRERVLELVEAKAKGKVVRLPKASKQTETKALATALKQSLAAAKRERKSA